jgi:hypothetical protein
MRWIVLLAISFITFSALTQNDKPFSYQGDVLGQMTYQQFVDKHPNVINQGGVSISPFSCGDSAGSTRSCYSNEVSFDFVNNRLAIISMEIGRYSLDDYAQALTAKFGAPVVTSAPYVNAMGASLTGQIWTWTNSISRIVLTQYGGETINIGTLTYSDIKLAGEYKSLTNPVPAL